MSHLEVLESELRTFQIDLPQAQKLTLAAYCDEVARWNRKINLTGLSGADLVRRLVVEPVWVGLQLKPAGILADIGSGNGSPAIPLHVVCRFQTCHLIEVRAKRAAFLRHVIAALQVSDAIVHKSRFEVVAPSLGHVDWITVQGVALSVELINSIKVVATSTTTVVWITSAAVKRVLEPSELLVVPHTDSKVLLFRIS